MTTAVTRSFRRLPYDQQFATDKIVPLYSRNSAEQLDRLAQSMPAMWTDAIKTA